MTARRCAIYTRKSSEEGLDQSFNSLDAQREACEAYIKSQAHEGWTLVPGAYDDGGYSGGSMERPGLQRLMADLARGRIDVVVVYKVDRLTRSLADFAKIVETLDQQGASFVSVTQQFNTTSSMGRLTLNVLLSFAQFEREVTGERIRDKIAASKRKGMWMGGNLPLGYDHVERKLVVNEAEAETVRDLYRTYLRLGSASEVLADLRTRGIVSKKRVSRTGRTHGGLPFDRGALYHLLQNQVYLGRIVHRKLVHPGQHPAIVPQELFDRVQRKLDTNSTKRVRARSAESPHLLIGRVHDDRGSLMSPTWTGKGGHQYRYYVSKALVRGSKAEVGSVSRIPAGMIEGLVDATLVRRAADAPHRPGQAPLPADPATRLRTLVAKVSVSRELVEITLTPEGASMIGPRRPADSDVPMTIEVPVRLRRRGSGREIVNLDGDPTTPSKPDRSLIRAVVRANRWREMLEAGEATSPYDLARHEGCRVGYVNRLLPLAFLAPMVVEAILQGAPPRGVDVARPNVGLVFGS